MNDTTSDSAAYLARKAQFRQMLTLYGRKPVLEALNDESLTIHKLHLADSNRGGGIVDEIVAAAERRGVELRHHSRSELARISRNSKQDQGVACDIACPNYQSLEQLLAAPSAGHHQLMALDGVTNPQNLGMIVRSVAASPLHGLLVPDKGCAELSSLVIKASAGALFKAPLCRVERLLPALRQLRDAGYTLAMLSSHRATPMAQWQPPAKLVYVMGNETHGVSAEVVELCEQRLMIPMANGVESLNVAVAAALVAFSGSLAG
jgi:23S rRNA (guanosine2251-2'-O)-methyltransferase